LDKATITGHFPELFPKCLSLLVKFMLRGAPKQALGRTWVEKDRFRGFSTKRLLGSLGFIPFLCGGPFP
jgi:hypothetical protein